MTNKQAFIFGILARCAEEGLTADETRERACRVAAMHKSGILGPVVSGLQSLGSSAASALGSVASTAGRAALPLAIMTPLAGGAGLGYLSAKLSDDHFDAHDAQMDETIIAYQRALADLRQAQLERERRLSS